MTALLVTFLQLGWWAGRGRACNCCPNQTAPSRVVLFLPSSEHWHLLSCPLCFLNSREIQNHRKGEPWNDAQCGHAPSTLSVCSGGCGHLSTRSSAVLDVGMLPAPVPSAVLDVGMLPAPSPSAVVDQGLSVFSPPAEDISQPTALVPEYNSLLA